MPSHDIEKSILVQKKQIEKSSEKVSELKKHLDSVSSTQDENISKLNELDSLSEDISKKLGIDREALNLNEVETQISLEDKDIKEIESNLNQFKPLESIEYINWEDYKTKVNSIEQRNDHYCLHTSQGEYNCDALVVDACGHN